MVVFRNIEIPNPNNKAKKYTHQWGKLNTTDTKNIDPGIGNTTNNNLLLLIV